MLYITYNTALGLSRLRLRRLARCAAVLRCGPTPTYCLQPGLARGPVRDEWCGQLLGWWPLPAAVWASLAAWYTSRYCGTTTSGDHRRTALSRACPPSCAWRSASPSTQAIPLARSSLL